MVQVEVTEARKRTILGSGLCGVGAKGLQKCPMRERTSIRRGLWWQTATVIVKGDFLLLTLPCLCHLSSLTPEAAQWEGGVTEEAKEMVTGQSPTSALQWHFEPELGSGQSSQTETWYSTRLGFFIPKDDSLLLSEKHQQSWDPSRKLTREKGEKTHRERIKLSFFLHTLLCPTNSIQKRCMFYQ